MRFSIASYSLATALALGSSASAAFSGCPANLAVQITNNLQNGNVHFDYGSCRLSKTGTGYEVGAVNFLTAGPDVYHIVKAYDALTNSDNEFNSMRDILKANADNYRPSAVGLEGLCDAWSKASANDSFKTIQNAIFTKNYFNPSQQYADRVGLQQSVNRALMLNTAIVHGSGSSVSMLGGMVRQTNKLVTQDMVAIGDTSPLSVTNGGAAYKVSEANWAELFLQTRARFAENGENNVHIRSFRYAMGNNAAASWEDSVKYLDGSGSAASVSCGDTYSSYATAANNYLV
ncbi:hypothetical protein GGI15_003901 [Coemansia interrupta]|uniref:Uncharacterized protein n=1 Tax=Coemansia interrupta TaxID=1126814 RepID=A0A9W8H6U2_9FUNG|nr:hypothetical protein GGI15_003901 [Coemansia interrupta]